MATFLNLLSGGMILTAVVPGIFSWRLRFQKDDKHLNQNKRTRLELKIQELAKKLEINKPIELIEKRNLWCGAEAQGLALFSCRAGIAIDPDLVNAIPVDELEFLIAHELSHIKANDLISMGVIPSAIGVLTTLAMSLLFPATAANFSPMVAMLLIPSPAALVGVSVSAITFALFSKWREKCADKLGRSICSDAAKKTAFHFYDRVRRLQFEYRNDENCSFCSKILRRFLFSEDGDFRLDVLHPPLSTRIKYLQTTL